MLSGDPKLNFVGNARFLRSHRGSNLRGTGLFSSSILIFFQYACPAVRPDFRKLPIGIYIDKHVFSVP